MAILLILAPYGLFTALMLVAPATTALLAAAATCLATVLVDLARGRSAKILPAGSVVIFLAIAAYLAAVDPAIGAPTVKFAVDVGLFAISVGSILLGHPFTLQYAVEAVPAETAALPGFLRANYIITAAWAAAMLLMMAANLLLIYLPALPIWSSIAIALAARNSAVYFTKWYPARLRMKYPVPASAPVTTA